MEPRPTWSLTERIPAEVPLTPDDVDFLLAHHRPHLQLLPTRQSGLFRVTPTGYVGTILAPGCRLLLQPKIPIRNVLYLLDANVELPALADSTTAMPGGDVIDLLAAQLAHRLAERAAAGLRRGYQERAEAGAFLQGRLDVTAQLRDPQGRRDQLHCQFDDFTTDVLCNQLPRATAERVLAWPLLSAPVRQSLRHALTAFADVRPVPLDERLFETALTDRLNRDYRPLLDLCRLLAESLTPTSTAGPLTAPAFLLNLERLFERFLLSRIANYFDGATGGVRAVVQPWCRLETLAGVQPELAIRPDLLLQRAGQPLLVLDAKWKRLSATRLVTADVYQVLAYCAALDVRRAVLVYPGRRDRAWHYRLGSLPIQLTVRTLCLVGDLPRLELAVRRLLRVLGEDRDNG